MNFFPVFLSSIIVLTQSVVISAESTDHHGVYYNELEVLKKTPATKMMFDRDAHQGLAEIQRDILTYKNLTYFQRLVRSFFLDLDVVIVIPETMPLLYAYVDGICKKADIATPVIFITRNDGFFNAFAQKLFVSTGAIVLGQKLINDLSDDAIEAIVAHEIGHIKHNHNNKLLGLAALDLGIFLAILAKLQNDLIQDGNRVSYFAKLYVAYNAVSLISALIVNKRFEKEADQFAYEANGKGQGLIEFFELILKKDQLREEEFAPLYELLQKNRSNLSTVDYYELVARYYLARASQCFVDGYKKIYYETFIGAHPSPQARITAIKKYLEIQQA